MLDRSMYSKNLTRVQTKIRELEAKGLSIPGTQEIILDSLSEVESEPRVVVVSDTSTPQSVAVFSESDVNLTVLSDYSALSDPDRGVRNTDMVILEASARRLNQDHLAKFGIGVGLFKTGRLDRRGSNVGRHPRSRRI